ncbi:hypothetical protein RM51_00340 [Chryseobacterium taiwanense]|uniref:Uncharacterized protein n=2 Tax=Chryseobacterium taiwanense TaxID=363331 RepID=A0A0B4EE84_9FLAO|nr:hypothetical protein RM51_00340 [Chryseobacterium taiwanense]
MINKQKSIVIGLLIFGLLIYVMKYKIIKNPQVGILKNTKYTIGKITSKFNYNKRRPGYDFIFVFNNDRKEGHQNGSFIPGHKYLVAYDSTNIKNGFLILDKFDVTDSLEKYHLSDKDQVYWEGWSLQKIPFQYDKSDIGLEVKEVINSYR